jgi:hypothetical protein
MGKYNWKVKKKKLDVVLEESKMKTLLLFILILFLFVSLSTSMRAIRSGQVRSSKTIKWENIIRK